MALDAMDIDNKENVSVYEHRVKSAGVTIWQNTAATTAIMQFTHYRL